MNRTIHKMASRNAPAEASGSSTPAGRPATGVRPPATQDCAERGRRAGTTLALARDAAPPTDAALLEARGVPASRAMLASVSLAALLAALGTSIANVGLPTLAQEFSAPLPRVQWVVLAYLLAVTTLVVCAGRLGDLAGKRRLFLAGHSLFTAASLACGLAPSLWLLVAARAAQGAGAAVMMALSLALVADGVPKPKLGRAMGLLATSSAIGTALGPSIGGVLISTMGWRAIFLLTVPLGVITTLLAARALPVDRREIRSARASFDYPGALLLMLTLAAYALAMTLGRGSFGLLNVTLLLVAFGGVAAFARVERSAPFPLLRLAIFRDSALRAGLAASAIVSTVVMSTLVVGPFYLALGLGLKAALVGVVMAIGPVVAALSGVPAGRMIERFGPRRMVTAGLLGMATGSLTLSMLPGNAGVTGYIAGVVIITAGYALFQTANQTAVMSEVTAETRGVIAGMLNLSRNVGLISGASLMAAVFAHSSGMNQIGAAIPATVDHGMRVTFALAATFTLAAVGISHIAARASSATPGTCLNRRTK